MKEMGIREAAPILEIIAKEHLTATGGTLIIIKRDALLKQLVSLITLGLYSMSLFVCCPQEVRFTLDRCSGAAVMEMEGLGSWLTTEDHSACEVTGVTPNTDRYTQTTEPAHTYLCF